MFRISSLLCRRYLSRHARFSLQERLRCPSAAFLFSVWPITALVQECRTFSRNGECVCQCCQNFQSKCFQQALGDHYLDSYQRKHRNLRKPTGFGNFKSFVNTFICIIKTELQSNIYNRKSVKSVYKYRLISILWFKKFVLQKVDFLNF